MKKHIFLVIGLLCGMHNIEVNTVSFEFDNVNDTHLALGAAAVSVMGTGAYFLAKKYMNTYRLNSLKKAYPVPAVNLSHVAGYSEAKKSLQRYVRAAQSRKGYRDNGFGGVDATLLIGAPGSGKSLFAEAVAGEIGAFYVNVSIPQLCAFNIVQIQALFAQFAFLSSVGPVVVLFDKLDNLGTSPAYYSILAEVEKFINGSYGDNIILLGTLMSLENLPHSMVLPGKFGNHVHLVNPVQKYRKDIFEMYLNKVEHGNIDIDELAMGAEGFSVAGIISCVRRAISLSIERGSAQVESEDLEEALLQMTAGEEYESLEMSEQELKVIAYHEAGHALMMLLSSKTNWKFHSITIRPRGGALGFNLFLTKEETFLVSKDEFLERIMIGLGGRAAEELVFNLVSSGASGDFMMATEMVRTMICDYGMTDEFGKVIYKNRQSPQFDAFIKETLEEQYEKVLELLEEHRDKLDALASALLEKNTLSAQEVYDILGIEYPEGQLA